MSFFEKRRLAHFAGDIDRVRAEVLMGSPKSLLDLGGGDGALTWAIAHSIPRIAVVEPQAAKRARGTKRRPEIEFLEGTGEKIPVPDGSFERVISIVAFHHFADQKAALIEIRRAMQNEGRLILFEVRPQMAPGRFWRLFAGHTHFLTSNDLSQLVSATGFTAVRTLESPSGYLVTAAR